MMSDYMFGTGMNEAMRWQTVHNKTFFYVFNYFSWNDYLPYYRGMSCNICNIFSSLEAKHVYTSAMFGDLIAGNFTCLV